MEMIQNVVHKLHDDEISMSTAQHLMRHVLFQGGPIGLVWFVILGHLFTVSRQGGKNICIPPILHLWNSTIIHLFNLRFVEHQHLQPGVKKNQNEIGEGCHSL